MALLWVASKVRLAQNSTQTCGMLTPLEFGQKSGLNLIEDFSFLVFIYANQELRSFCSSFYLPFQFSGYAPAPPRPFENPAYATDTVSCDLNGLSFQPQIFRFRDKRVTARLTKRMQNCLTEKGVNVSPKIFKLKRNIHPHFCHLLFEGAFRPETETTRSKGWQLSRVVASVTYSK